MASSPARVSWISLTPRSEEDLLMDQKVKKRKLSNRESARRSRIRKQNHIEDLADEVDKLRKQQQQLKANLNLSRQLCMNVEAEASMIQTQMAELSYQLAFLNEISSYIMSMHPLYEVEHEHESDSDSEHYQQTSGIGSFIMCPSNNPISASADIFMF